MSHASTLLLKASGSRTNIEQVGELEAAGRLVQAAVVAAAHLDPGDLEVAAQLADSGCPLLRLGSVHRGCNAENRAVEFWQRKHACQWTRPHNDRATSDERKVQHDWCANAHYNAETGKLVLAAAYPCQ